MTVVRPGETGVDFSWTKPPASRLVELGYTFVVGYISVPPASAGKNITKAQCDEYIAAGLKVLLVWEMSAETPNQGYWRGRTDGVGARIQAEKRGYPVDVPILTAVDTNTTTANIGAHTEYVRGFVETVAPYPVGIYGDTDILRRVQGWRIGWVPNAWGWSAASRVLAEAEAAAVGAHVLQRKGFYIDDKWAVDPNVAVREFPAWGKSTLPHPETPPPAPIPPVLLEEDDMHFITHSEQRGDKAPGIDVWAIMPDGSKRPVSWLESVARGGVAKLAPIPVPNDVINGLSDYSVAAPGTAPRYTGNIELTPEG